MSPAIFLVPPPENIVMTVERKVRAQACRFFLTEHVPNAFWSARELNQHATQAVGQCLAHHFRRKHMQANPFHVHVIQQIIDRRRDVITDNHLARERLTSHDAECATKRREQRSGF
ncbi:MAG: hypothetical protein Q4A98_08230 [Comamonadaceae bacterium]|nr:hypothetical protein [Comamonadaceae bacterium]